jgi:hypothetical protein
MKLGMYVITAPESISTAYFINPSQQSVCLYVYPLSFLRNGSVNTFPWQSICAKIVELFEASFSTRSVSYQRTLNRSVCVSPNVARQRLGKQVPETTKNCWRRHFPYGPCLKKGQSVGLSVYSLMLLATAS